MWQHVVPVGIFTVAAGAAAAAVAMAACGTNIYKVENVGDGGGSIYHFDRDIPAAAELLPVTRLQYRNDRRCRCRHRSKRWRVVQIWKVFYCKKNIHIWVRTNNVQQLDYKSRIMAVLLIMFYGRRAKHIKSSGYDTSIMGNGGKARVCNGVRPKSGSTCSNRCRFRVFLYKHVLVAQWIIDEGVRAS